MFIVHIAGHLGKDPETRFTANGQKVTSFSVAVNQRKGKEDVTVWVRVTVWGDRFDKMISFLKRGSAVIVTGKMNPPSTYVDKEGRTQVTLEITAEMIEFSPFGRTDKPEGQLGSQNNYNAQQYGTSYQPNNNYAHQNAPDSSYSKSNASAPYGNFAAGQGAEHEGMDEDTLPF